MSLTGTTMQSHRGRPLAAAILACLAASVAARTQAAAQYFDIPAQPASDAVKALALQSELQIAAQDADLDDIRTNALQGSYEPLDALRRLLGGTGLEVDVSSPTAVVIRRQVAQADGSAQTLDSEARTKNVELEEIVITGSRIKRTGFDTLEAALVTDSSEIQRRAYTNIGQALEATPGFGQSDASPVSAVQGTYSVGQTFVNFFGLGSQRTLTLVNGRRYVSSNAATGNSTVAAGSQVDLNLIPAGLVDRVETIAIGGAAVYGSDAIAGTVNIILKDDFEGVEGSAQFGMTQQSDQESQSYRVLMGDNFASDRGNVVLSLERNRQQGLMMDDRFDYALQVRNPNDTGPNDGISALRVAQRARYGILTEGGLPYDPNNPVPGLPLPGFMGVNNFVTDAAGNPLHFAANGQLVPYGRGVTVEDYGLGAPVFTDGGDGLNPASHVTLVAPLERTLVNAISRFDVSPSVRLFMESSYARTEGVEKSDLYQFSAPLIFGGPALDFSVNNPFLSSQARDILVANGLTRFALNRNFNDIVDRTPGRTRLDVYRIVSGVQGELQVSDQQWSWDVSYNYGRSRNSSRVADIDPVKLLNAVDAVFDGSGNIVCASAAENPDCVPINLFGENAFSAAAADYVSDMGAASSKNTLQVATANLTGRLPFGVSDPISFNIGYEHRKEEASFEPDAIHRMGIRLLGGLNGARGVSGGFKTDEVYAEVVTPLISEKQGSRAVKFLSLEGAVRYVDNSLAGGATTWSAGGRFEPRFQGWGDGLMLRAVYTEAIRAPGITELFSGVTPEVTLIRDPCDQLNVDSGANPATRRANCSAALATIGAGSPDGFNSTTDRASASGILSGNRSLDNEVATSWSAGVVYQPSAQPNLRVAIDWSDISLEGGIENLGINQRLAACYDSPNFPNEATCGSFRRLTAAEAASQPGAGRITGDIADGYTTGYINTSKIHFAGLIAAAAYQMNLRGGQLGALRFNAILSYVDRFEVTSNAGTPTEDVAGTVGYPRYRLSTSVGYSIGAVDMDLQALWRDAAVASKTATIEQTPVNDLPSYTLWNGTLGYRYTDRVRAQLAIHNLLDEPMPRTALANLGFGFFDPLGRRYFLTLQTSF